MVGAEEIERRGERGKKRRKPLSLCVEERGRDGGAKGREGKQQKR